MNTLIEGDINSSSEREIWNSQQTDTNTKQLLTEDARYFLHQSLSSPCLEALNTASGSTITTLGGKKLYDFHGNNVHQLGHANPVIIEAIQKQLAELAFCPRRYTNGPAVALAKKLASLMPGSLNRSLFMPGGTSSISTALKVARLVTGKHKVISCWDSFHGASLDAISAGGEAIFRKHMGPLMPGVERVPPSTTYRGVFTSPDENDIKYADYIEYVVEKEGDIGAILIETIRNTDVQIPSVQYWKKIREICNKHNILLILDEIPIALGRTGYLFAFEHYCIEPDILCIGKGFGGGIIPMSAMITRDEYNDAASEVSLGHFTHEKSPVGAAAALATFEYIENYNILDKVRKDQEYLNARFSDLKTSYDIIGDVRGIGLLWGIELVSNRETKEKANIAAEQVLYRCLNDGLSFKVSQGNVLQLSPPLTITRKELDHAISIIDKNLFKVSRKNGNTQIS